MLVLIALERYLAQVDFDLHLAVFSPGLTVLYILASLASLGNSGFDLAVVELLLCLGFGLFSGLSETKILVC